MASSSGFAGWAGAVLAALEAASAAPLLRSRSPRDAASRCVRGRDMADECAACLEERRAGERKRERKAKKNEGERREAGTFGSVANEVLSGRPSCVVTKAPGSRASAAAQPGQSVGEIQRCNGAAAVR